MANQSTTGDLKFKVKQVLGNLLEMPGVTSEPPTVSNAEALTERYRFHELLPYRGFDTENKLVIMDDGEQMSVGIGIEISPAIIAGEDMENVIENLLVRCPTDTVAQMVLYSSPDVYRALQSWLEEREKHTDKFPLLKEMARRRASFLSNGSFKRSLLPGQRVHTRYVYGYVFLRIPYKGEMRDPVAVDSWIEQAVELQNAASGILSGGKIAHRVMDERDHRRVIMQLLNPHFEPETLDKASASYAGFPDNLIRKESRITVDKEGVVQFKGGESDRSAVVVTVDSYPEELTISHTRMLTGDLLNREDRISDPFWLWTAIHIMDPDDAKDKMNRVLGLLNRQTMSESAWFRSMAGPLFKRRDDTTNLMGNTESRHQIIRMATGVVVYTTPDRARQSGEAVSSMWRKGGFQASPERYISLPMFIASLPYGYNYKNDTGNNGLSRLEFANSFNAACAAPIAADWKGHDMSCGGPTFTTRRGQIASLDLMKEETNYNMTVVAQSGSGKSFFSAELVCDYLSRGGIVRVIDVGRSYQRLAEVLGGQVMEFKPNDPKSINPFWGVTTIEDCNENLPTWKEIVELMAFPKGQADSWTYQQIEDALGEVWSDKRDKMGMADVYHYFRGHSDERLHGLADQLKPYAVGRLSAWFNGEPEVAFGAEFSILELEELNADKHLRTVVLTLVINMIIRDMYRYEKAGQSLVPKLLLIDEAWDLMGRNSGNTGHFIEEAARRIRKYRGSLLTVTQSYADYFMSDGAQAALTNSAWRCSLAQSGQSIRSAQDNKVIPGGDFVWPLLQTVKRGPGYSELHICNSAGVGDIFRLIIDPFSYYTYTTNPDDKNAIAQQIGQGKSMLEAISYLADQMEEKVSASMRV